MTYLDLAELPQIVGRRGLIGATRHATRAFLREDHLFRQDVPLDVEVREIIKDRTGHLPTGPIRLLTQLRHFGLYFSPLNLFYVFDQQGETVEFVLAEVNNTPWNDRHCYLLEGGDRPSIECSHAKEFHVSPFMDMAMKYEWEVSQPGDELSVQIRNVETCYSQEELFQADLQLERRPLNAAQLRRVTWRHPFMTAKITMAIYLQASKLWWKRCPFYRHPKKSLTS